MAKTETATRRSTQPTTSSRQTSTIRKPAKTTPSKQTQERTAVSRPPSKRKRTSFTPKTTKTDETVAKAPTRSDTAPESPTSTRTGAGHGRRAPRQSSEPSRQGDKLSKVLSKPWNEDTARKMLSEGFLASLAVPLRSANPPTEIDSEGLQERLKDIRKVLAEECMVQDDATDIIVLDAVMNALADRIEVYRIQAENGDLKGIEQTLDLRHKADRRLIEAVAALKNP